ncbi:Cytoplasmic tRNA 2-thiolation protein 2 [Yarrowia sp. C11]|nr:Cytoplasmic tRNA 2-thiolation protein 2 [Yarrowia sp. E02]KAG5372943.1 Cytoplasmic tRNA 2-thiolation protein 2 [Yarrowia sp. C11]
MSSTCRRCDGPTAIKTRQANFCESCFITFIQQKQRKAMEGCKVLFERPGCVLPPAINILVPISFGKSSLALLDMAHSQLEEQAKTYENAAGFTLNAVFIDCSEADILEKKPTETIQELQKQFPLAKFTSVPLSRAFEDTCAVSLKHNKDYSSFVSEISEEPTSVQHLLSSIGTKSAREDIISVLQRHLIIEEAHKQNLTLPTTVAWGHNATRLAELTLSLTIKGRGNRIHAQVLEHKNPQDSISGLPEIHPLNDVLSYEIPYYNSFRNVSHLEVNSLSKPSQVTKNLSIDQLMHQYFENIQTNFPSIASTVVRTAAKLDDPNAGKEGLTPCLICASPVDPNQSLAWLTNITVNEPAAPETEEEELSKKAEIEKSQESKETDKNLPVPNLCYGCIITIRDTDKMSFPKRASKQEILDEFTL